MARYYQAMLLLLQGKRYGGFAKKVMNGKPPYTAEKEEEDAHFVEKKH